MQQFGALGALWSAGMCRRSHGTLQELLVDGFPSRLEPLALEESGFVEAIDEVADLLGRRSLSVTSSDDLLDLGHRMLAVEERDEVEQRKRENRDLLRESRRVTQSDHPLAVLLDGKGFEHSKPWPFVHRESPRPLPGR